MQKSKLFQLYQSLDKRELKELLRFCSSSFFNQQKQVISLLSYLNSASSKPKTKESAFANVFANAPYDDTKMRLCMSALNQLIEHFLLYKHHFKDPIRNEIELAGIYRNRQLGKHFEQTIKKAEALQEKKAIRNSGYFHNRFQIQFEKYQFISSNKRTLALNLQDLNDNIDLSYVAQKLRHTCYLLSHQSVYKTDYDFGLLDEVTNYIEQRGLLEIPVIGIYYNCYLSLTKPDQEIYFERFSEQLRDEQAIFSGEEIRDLYLFAINYCIKKLNSGKADFAKRGLVMYQAGLDSGVLLENNILSRFTYNNMVAMALKHQDHEWVDVFTEKYKKFLEPNFRESTYSFNRARLAYARRDFDEALGLLQQADFKDLLNNLIAKTLMLKIYFELKEFKSLDYHLDTMKIFIQRKKVIGYHKKNYSNIIKYTKKLVAMNTYNKDAVANFRAKVEAEEILTEKDWLLAQI